MAQTDEPNTQQIERLALSVAEACAATGLGKTTIYKLIENGKLRSKRVEGRRLIMCADLRACLDMCTS
jgi:excisionase family DNA binding protein